MLKLKERTQEVNTHLLATGNRIAEAANNTKTGLIAVALAIVFLAIVLAVK